jgi:Fe2+ transport system protein FeoA
MADRYLTCPFCGLEFEPDDTLCRHGCPLDNVCTLVQCPGCEYEFPEKPRTFTWLQRVFRRRSDGRPKLPEEVLTVRNLRSGERAEVLCLAGGSPSRHNTLAVFGLVPGTEITLVQRHPSYVIRIGETELALDSDIAQGIVVKRPDD